MYENKLNLPIWSLAKVDIWTSSCLSVFFTPRSILSMFFLPIVDAPERPRCMLLCNNYLFFGFITKNLKIIFLIFWAKKKVNPPSSKNISSELALLCFWEGTIANNGGDISQDLSLTHKAGVPPSKQARFPDTLWIDGLWSHKIVPCLVTLDQVFELC